MCAGLCLFLEQSAKEGESPVLLSGNAVRIAFIESRTLEVVCQRGGSWLLKLSILSRSIVNKYREGKVKRTLKRELNAPEIAEK